MRYRALEQQCQQYQNEAARADALERKLEARDEECERLRRQLHASQANQSASVHPVPGNLVATVPRGEVEEAQEAVRQFGTLLEKFKAYQ